MQLQTFIILVYACVLESREHFSVSKLTLRPQKPNHRGSPRVLPSDDKHRGCRVAGCGSADALASGSKQQQNLPGRKASDAMACLFVASNVHAKGQKFTTRPAKDTSDR